MIRKLPSATLVAALAGALALAGCNKADDTNDAAIDTTPPPAAGFITHFLNCTFVHQVGQRLNGRICSHY